uniref:Uncharacterized protein n=1 Tax=Oryza meridionalis TaxID=40149 RepID=A0A0E0F4D1_9ORYZ
MVVSYLARAVWQTRRDVSSSTVRQHRLFGVIFLNDHRILVTVIIFSASSLTTTLWCPMRTVRLGYLDISFPTTATSIMATLRTASLTTASSQPSFWLRRLWHKGL